MQDWNYIHAGCFELTLEISDDKWPPANEVRIPLALYADFFMFVLVTGTKSLTCVTNEYFLGLNV